MKNNTYRTVAALATACMTFAAFATTIKWKADDSGNWSGDFGDPNHWEGGVAPGASDEAYFPNTSPNVLTVTVNANYTIGSMNVYHYSSSGRTITFSGTGKITASQSGMLNNYGEYCHVIFNGASFQSAGEARNYGTVEVLAGSTFVYSRNFYHWGAESKFIVDGGTCSFQQFVCNGSTLESGIFVKRGSLSGTNLLGNYAGKPMVLDVSGGTAEFNKLAMTVAGGKIKLSDGTLKVKTDAVDALNVDAGVEVSLTGGTFVSGHSVTDQRFYATDGADVEIASTRFVMVTNGTVTAKSKGALTARGFYNGSTADCVIHGTFPRIVFAHPDGHFYVTSGTARNFYFYGPTVIGTKCNMIFNSSASTSYTYFKGDFTIDTLDYVDRTTPRTIWIRGIHPLDGESTLTVTGGGTFQALQTASYNSFKSITVDNDTTLALLDCSTAVSDMGPLMAETFTMKPGAALTFTAGLNYVQAKTFAIDPTATITVTVPSTFTNAAPILQTIDLSSPGVPLSQITLTGSTEGVLLKSEHGQITVYKPGVIDGMYANEWKGGGADNKFSTAENWYSGALPAAKQIIYFGASMVTNPKWGSISGGGSTVGGYWFRDTACETFTYSSGGETIEPYQNDGATICVGTWSGVPQMLNGSLRRLWWSIDFVSRGLAPLVIGGDGTYTWASQTEANRCITIRGDVRLNKNGYTGSGIYFYNAIGRAPYTRLTVMPGVTATLSMQTRDFDIRHAGLRVEDGATLAFGNGDGAVYRWTLEPAKQIVYGTLDIQAPLYGGVKQTYGGTGRLNIATVKSGTAASRVQFADGLNVYPGDWTTVTSDADNPVAISAIGGTPTIHLSSNWRYGVASGVTTASAAASRALEVQKGAELTLDAGGHTATIDEDVSGEGTLVITNGTLAVNSTAANDVTLKVAANGTLAMSDDLNFGSLEMEAGSAVSFANGKTVNLSGSADISGATVVLPSGMSGQRGWKTVLVAADGVNVSGCTLPPGFEMRTENVTGGVALQLRYLHGINIIIR